MDDRADRLQEAVDCFRARREREAHPDGEFTRPGGTLTWTIAETERQPCCASAKPSDLGGNQRFVGHWLNQHCRTVEHVANLFGVAADELRAALKAKPATTGQLKLF